MIHQKNEELMQALRAAGVEMILVGGVAATVHGSVMMTIDLDVLMPYTEENWARVIAALKPFRPIFAKHPARIPLHQDPAAMAPFRFVMLETTMGRLDLLKEIPGGTYADLLPTCVWRDVLGGPTQVLGLDALIASKEHLGRDKDKPAVIELRAIRERLAKMPAEPEPESATELESTR